MHSISEPAARRLEMLQVRTSGYFMGGAITADNASQVLGLAEVGGVLIGDASLLAVDFDVVLDCVPKPLTDRG